jgi:hypothetical protein
MFSEARYFSDIGSTNGGIALLWWDYSNNPDITAVDISGKGEAKVLYSKLMPHTTSAIEEAYEKEAILLRLKRTDGIARVIDFHRRRCAKFENDPKEGEPLPAIFVGKPEPRRYGGEDIQYLGLWYSFSKFRAQVFESEGKADFCLTSYNGVLVEVLGKSPMISVTDYFRGMSQDAEFPYDSYNMAFIDPNLNRKKN